MDVRDQTWVRELAARRGFSVTDRSTGRELIYELGGSLGLPGRDHAWHCVVTRSFLDDGGAECVVRWTCPALTAASPAHELVVSYGDGGGGGSADAAALAGAALLALVRGRRRRAAGPDDVLSRCDVHDPGGLFAGEVRHRFTHWPVVDPPAEWVRSLRGLVGAAEEPPDAPPQGTSLGMAGRTPLGVVTRDWWQASARLEHQIDLGIAAGRAVVAADRHT